MSEVKILTIVNLMDFNNDWIELDNRCDVSMIPIDNLISIVLERVKTGEKEISVQATEGDSYFDRIVLFEVLEDKSVVFQSFYKGLI